MDGRIEVTRDEWIKLLEEGYALTTSFTTGGRIPLHYDENAPVTSWMKRLKELRDEEKTQ